MSRICIPIEAAERFKTAIADGRFDVDTLAAMDSQARKIELAKFIDIKSVVKKKIDGKEVDFIASDDLDKIAARFNRDFEDRIKTVSVNRNKKWDDMLAKAQNKIKSGEITTDDVEKKFRDWEGKLLTRQRELLNNLITRNTEIKAKGRTKTTTETIADIRHILDPAEKEAYLEEIVKAKMGFEIPPGISNHLAQLSDESEAALKGINDRMVKLKEKFYTSSASDGAKKRKAEIDAEYSKLRDEAKNIEGAGAREDYLKEIDGDRARQMKDLDLEANEFARKVMMGEIDEAGKPLSKAERKKLETARVAEGYKATRMLEFVSEIKDMAEQGLLQGKTAKQIELGLIDDLGAGEKEAVGMLKSMGTFTKNKWREKVTLSTDIGPTGQARNFIRFMGAVAYQVLGGTKGIVASFDFSYLFRQGWQTMFTDPKIWAKNAKRSIGSMRETFTPKTKKWFEERGITEVSSMSDADFARLTRANKDKYVLRLIRAEIQSRPNAVLGKYDLPSNKMGLNIFNEEQFPSTWPRELPAGAGKIFQATETGFTGMSLRMRADLADSLFYQLEKAGVNIYDQKIADELGLLVGAMTGRGHPFGVRALEREKDIADFLNVTIFSPRFVGSQFHTVAAIPKYLWDPKNPVKALSAKKAAIAIAGGAATMASLHMITRMFWGDEAGVDFNTGSRNFGYLKFPNGIAYDLTGSHGSVIALAGRLADSWGSEGMQYDARLGIYLPQQFNVDTIDILTEFFLNKTSPAGTLVKDIVNGHQFGDESLMSPSLLMNLFIPLTVQNVVEVSEVGIQMDGLMPEVYGLDSPDVAAALLFFVAEMVGISAKEVQMSPNSKDFKMIREASPDAYNKARTEFNEEVRETVTRLRNDKEFQKLPPEEQYRTIKLESDRIKREIPDKYIRELGLDQE